MFPVNISLQFEASGNNAADSVASHRQCSGTVGAHFTLTRVKSPDGEVYTVSVSTLLLLQQINWTRKMT